MLIQKKILKVNLQKFSVFAEHIHQLWGINVNRLLYYKGGVTASSPLGGN